MLVRSPPKKVYTTNGNNRISKKQLNQRQAILSKRIAQQIQTDFLVAYTITDSFYAGDTLIKKVRFEVINTQLEEEKSWMPSPLKKRRKSMPF